MTTKQRIISHGATNVSIERVVANVKKHIIQQGEVDGFSVERQCELVDELCHFGLGCYFLCNRGFNGYWTHYFLTQPWYGRKTGLNDQGKPYSNLENFFLNKAPIVLATQQRFQIFLQQNQRFVKSSAKLACVPAGFMGELLYLNFHGVSNIELIGIDLDVDNEMGINALAAQKNLNECVQFQLKDAWHLEIHDEFDLISSNGLNIYASSNEDVIALYRNLYDALKAGGSLVTSFLTYPPMLAEKCEWDMDQINKADLLLQKVLFKDIARSAFTRYASSEQTLQDLRAIGFRDIQIIYDQARMFPTVVATK